MSGIKITFGDDNKERTFETREAAERYLETIKQENVLPNTYELVVEQIESDSA
ncbi:hypothetical protein [Pontibacillus sp. HMF3514]|uniref:hypothetical protein n=1 Tax=Pontibacillus sp. HMF3514 TaxID=2692425 RepID=UPI00131FF8BC|nr:hypothetical protein [Pontibacillus sp. HMF3514]QHE53108.1 hypothetical protein GS400_14245 [Pontibacillus sp. HMF3514]